MTNAPQQYPGQQPPYYSQQPPYYPGNTGHGRAPRPRKPWFKRWWIWAIIGVVLIVLISQGTGGGGGTTTAQTAATSVTTTASAAAQQHTSAAQPADQHTAAQPAQTKPPQTTSAKAALTLDDGWTLDKSNEFALYVDGYVSNNTGKAITGYAQITFDELDSQGANLGTCLDNTNTIDAYGKWKFKALCTGSPDEVATVRLKEVTGY